MSLVKWSYNAIIILATTVCTRGAVAEESCTINSTAPETVIIDGKNATRGYKVVVGGVLRLGDLAIRVDNNHALDDGTPGWSIDIKAPGYTAKWKLPANSPATFNACGSEVSVSITGVTNTGWYWVVSTF